MTTQILKLQRDGHDVITPVRYENGYPPIGCDMMITAIDASEIGDELLLPSGRYKVRGIAKSDLHNVITKTINVERIGPGMYGFREAGSTDASQEIVMNTIERLVRDEMKEIDDMTCDPAHGENETTFRIRQDCWKASLKSLLIRAREELT